MIKIGITGNIGCGKSYICNIFEKNGIPVFYSDDETKKLYYDSEIKQLIMERFGEDIYQNDGTLDKAKMSRYLFDNEDNMQFIETTLYPTLFKHFDEWCERQNAPFVLFESAILFEKNLTKNFDKIIFVSAPEYIRIQRVMTRDKCSKETVRRRMNLQWSDEIKSPKADFVMIHDGNDDVETEVKKIISTLSHIQQSLREL